MIPADDGYGFEGCLAAKSACGMIVADAWCEAHGLARSKSFGPAADITTAADDGRPSDIEPGAFLVTCGEPIK